MGHCDTCQRKSKAGTKCTVLTEMIGKTQPCWAWTDNPDWRIKCEKDIMEYSERWKGNEEKAITA